MKNVKLILLACVALAALSSCQKHDIDVTDSFKEEEKTTITVNAITSLPTKIATTTADTDDKTVSNIQVLVFRSNYIEAYGTAKNATSLTLSCTKGKKDVYLVANYPQSLASVKNKTELLAKTVDMTDNASNAVVMVGHSDKVTMPDTKTVNITVKRLMCRIILEKVERQFITSAFETLPLNISQIFLVNVPKTVNFEMTSTPAAWYNQGAYFAGMDAKVEALINENLSGVSLTSSAPSNNTKHVFYSMPTVNSPETTPLRLVIYATINDQKYYYPITIPGLAANQSYLIKNVKIKRVGSNSPDIPVTFEDITFDVVKVDDWDTSKSIDEFSI